MTGPNQSKVIVMCLFLLTAVTIIVAVVNILVLHSLDYKEGPLFSKSCIRNTAFWCSSLQRSWISQRL